MNNEFFDDVQKAASEPTVEPTKVDQHTQNPDTKEEKSAPKIRVKRIMDPENYLSLGFVKRYRNFMIFVFIMTILYIANSHFAVQTQFNIKKLDEKIKELNSEYIILKSDIMNLSKQSEVAKMVESDSIKILKTPPTPIPPFQEQEP
jgi:cell division protein FtsL